MTVKRIKNIISKIRNGEVSSSEMDSLNKCLDSEEFESISQDAWDDAAEESVEKSLKKEMWKNISFEIENSGSGESAVQESKSATKKKTIFRTAAAVAVLCIGVLSYLLVDRSGVTTASDGGNVFAFEVAPGQKGDISLPDGTRVYMNSDSKITFSDSYNVNERVVTLNGEAFFEVAKNPERRFVVLCNGIEVEALGTKFNVKAYPSDSIVTTTLTEGKVKVYNDRQSVTLLPNGVATYDTRENSLKSHIVDDVMVANYWRSGHLVCKSEPMSSIAKTIERMYNVKINIEDQELRDKRFTGTIQNNSLTNVLYIMSLSYPLTYTINDSEITVSKAR